jgi:hypothetical protein
MGHLAESNAEWKTAIDGFDEKAPFIPSMKGRLKCPN